MISQRYSFLSSLLLIAMSFGCGPVAQSVDPNTDESDERNDSSDYQFEGTATWVSSARPPGGTLHIARTTSDGQTSEITYLTDSPYNDYKPVISPDGSKIAFFRAYSEGDDFFLWNTAICVMNADGSDLRELTGRDFMNTEPYWTRDASNRITWSRMIHQSEGQQGTYVYRTASDALPGDEQQISATGFEWSNSNLQDGRVFVLRAGQYYLMTPNPDGVPSYDLISYPDSYHYLHKGTISNDETRIAYMKSEPGDTDHYRPAEIVYADFDASIPAITSEFAFVPKDESKFSWYVSISPDNQFLLYAEDGKILLHDVAARATIQISTLNSVYFAYPTYLGSVK
jgi:Tol biopolymer transport system component